MMSAARVQEAVISDRLASLRLSDGDPLVVVHGPAVDDVFVGADYQIRTIHELLWERFRCAGFRRVVFSSLRQPVFFLDAESRDVSRRGKPRAPARAAGVMGNNLVGPMGRRVLPVLQTPATEAPPQPRVLSDQHGVMMLDHFMRQPEIRTAVVFTQAEESLRFIQSDRSLAAAVADWFGSSVGNLCVLVFRREGLDAVRDFVDGLRQFPRLESFLQQLRHRPAGRGSVQVGYPQDAELERLVHVLRLREGLRIGDWRGLAVIVRAMAATPASSIRDWQVRLRQVAARGDALHLDTLRQHGWLEAVLPEGRDVWERLDALRGLGTVKAHLERLRWQLTAEANLRAQGLAQSGDATAYHLVFTGNPGTGKTTVARLVGELYRDLGVLRRGHVVEAEVSELVADHTGGTAKATNRKIDEALDGVLFIDEVYRLSEQRGGFGKEAIDTLLTRMENDRDRLVVIVAGYPEQMDSFLSSNPGLRSRFPQANVISFPDYAPDDLYMMLHERLAHLHCTPEAETELRRVTESLYVNRDSDFGNARAMRDLATEVTARWAQRVRGAVREPVQPDDVPERYRSVASRQLPPVAELLAEMADLVGLAPVKELIADLAAGLELRKRRGTGDLVAPHMLFVGSPGTGKTTVARLLGRVFRSLGLLQSGEVVEVTRADLVGEWIGHTAPKTRAAIGRARDGVLFIDEAYSLTRDQVDGRDFGQEAIDTLVQEMENRRGRLVVIAAGYLPQMEKFLSANPGLLSRFSERVIFPDYTDDELVEILRRMAAKEGYVLPTPVQDRARQWLAAQRRKNRDEFGNARTVRGLFDQMERLLARRLSSQADETDLNTFAVGDVPDASG